MTAAPALTYDDGGRIITLISIDHHHTGSIVGYASRVAAASGRRRTAAALSPPGPFSDDPFFRLPTLLF